MNLNFEHYIYQIPAILLAMTMHEYARAIISSKLGDNSPKAQGRITLNPIKHAEIIGFALMLLYGYGWSLPPKTNPMAYNNRKQGVLIVNIAPSLINVAVGIFCMFIALGIGLLPHTIAIDIYTPLILIFVYAAKYNVALALFNVIPVHPMDGWNVAGLILPPNARLKLSHYEKIIQIVVILLLVLGLLQMVFDPICNAIIRL